MLALLMQEWEEGGAMAKKSRFEIGFFLVCLAGIAFACAAGEVFMNDLEQAASAFCITFSEPVAITEFGGPFATYDPSGQATVFTFTDGETPALGEHLAVVEPRYSHGGDTRVVGP